MRLLDSVYSVVIRRVLMLRFASVGQCLYA